MTFYREGRDRRGPARRPDVLFGHHTHLWKADVAQSVDLSNEWFMQFTPQTYRDTHVRTTADVKSALNEIEHRRTKVRRPQTNGFVERFNRTVLDEFFREAFQADLDAWLVTYNTERPHLGCRNLGRRPVDTIREYLKSRASPSPTVTREP